MYCCLSWWACFPSLGFTPLKGQSNELQPRFFIPLLIYSRNKLLDRCPECRVWSLQIALVMHEHAETAGCWQTCIKIILSHGRKLTGRNCLFLLIIATFYQDESTWWQSCVAARFVEESLFSRLFQSHGQKPWRTHLTPRKKNGHLRCIR